MPSDHNFPIPDHNRFGHPALETVERLEVGAHAQILRTDQMGTIVLTTDGHEINFSTIAPAVGMLNHGMVALAAAR